MSTAYNLFAADPLLQAMFQKDVDLVNALINDGADILQRKISGLSPLEVATRNQRRDTKERKIAALVVARCLLLPPELLSLKQAAQVSHMASVRHHLNRSSLSPLNAKEYDEATIYAVEQGHSSVVEMLLDAGVSANVRSQGFSGLPMHGEPLLTIAVGWARLDVAKLLLKRNADIDMVYSSYIGKNITALMEAVRFRSLSMVKLLVEAGAELTLRDGGGNYALTLAKLDGHKRIIAFLESSYTRARVFDNLNFHEAAREGVLSRVQQLSALEIELDQTDSQGETALMLAAKHGNSLVVSHLCQCGANVNAKSTNGRNLWDFALRANNLGVVQCLLKHGLNANLTLSNGMSPLVKAVEFCELEIIQELLDGDADIQATYTPKVPPMIEELFAGTSIAARKIRKSYRPCTALEYAKRCGNKKAYELLKELTASSGDRYDDVSATLKTLATLADGSFNSEVKRISKILQAKPQIWARRKGTVHFITSLGKSLSAYYLSAQPSNVLNLFAKNSSRDEIDLFKRLQSEVRARGYSLVYTELDFEGKPLARLLLFPTKDPLVVLAACGINAENFGMGTRDVVNWCAETMEQNPFNLLGVGIDFMELDFSLPIAYPLALVSRATEFCPEISNGSPDELEVLGKNLDTTGRCFFWWD